MPLRVALVIALAAAPAGAQPVDSFRELAELIEIGRSVVVITSQSGDVITGQLVDISPASLGVFAGGRKVELDEARVRRVRQRCNDPNSDGAARSGSRRASPLRCCCTTARPRAGKKSADWCCLRA